MSGPRIAGPLRFFRIEVQYADGTTSTHERASRHGALGAESATRLMYRGSIEARGGATIVVTRSEPGGAA